MHNHSETQLGDGEGLSEDEIFKILSLARRRELLRELDHAGGEASFGELTEAIATAESDTDSTRKGRKAVYVSLYQTHVPRLVDVGVVEHDEAAKSLRLTDRAADLLAYLAFDPAEQRGGLLARVFRARDRQRAE